MLTFNFHIGDFTKKTAHLTHEERGIYLSLLMRYYDTEQPLPADEAAVARLACVRNADAMRTVCDVLAEFFVLHDDGWRNERADEEIAKYHNKSASARASAKARWDKELAKREAESKRKKDACEGNANAQRTQCEGNANHEPRTTNHNNPINTSPGGDDLEQPPPDKPAPKPKAKAKPSDAEITDAFEVFWSAGMRKIDKKKARKAFGSIVKRDGLVPGDFARQLYNDVKARLHANVFGFKQLHPTTYLNGERWNDEIIDGNTEGRPQTPMEQFERAIRDRDAREAHDGLGMADDDRNVWSEMDQGAGQSPHIDLEPGDWETKP